MGPGSGPRFPLVTEKCPIQWRTRPPRLWRSRARVAWAGSMGDSSFCWLEALKRGVAQSCAATASTQVSVPFHVARDCPCWTRHFIPVTSRRSSGKGREHLEGDYFWVSHEYSIPLVAFTRARPRALLERCGCSARGSVHGPQSRICGAHTSSQRHDCRAGSRDHLDCPSCHCSDFRALVYLAGAAACCRTTCHDRSGQHRGSPFRWRISWLARPFRTRPKVAPCATL